MFFVKIIMYDMYNLCIHKKEVLYQQKLTTELTESKEAEREGPALFFYPGSFRLIVIERIYFKK